MKLTIRDRIQMPSLFPQRGNLIQMQLIEDISKKIQLDQETIKKVGFTQEGNGYKWKKEADIDVEFTDLELGMLQDKVKELDSKKEIDFTMGGLCKKISDAKVETKTEVIK